jgi:ubiquitin-conjugating enzyme E2 variant
VLRLAELLGVAGACALAGVLALRLARGAGAADAAPLLAGALLGWLAADLVSGLVHWWADRVASEETPLLGPLFVRPFREHHVDPTGICRHDFLATNGNTCLAALPALAAACLWLPAEPRNAAELAALAAALSLACFACLTNQIHQWAHRSRVSAAVRWLQRRRLILPPEHHAGHHRPPCASHYCITAGWLDPLLERAGLFPALERGLARIGRAAR